MAYQGTFAIITAALISGAIVERMRFGPTSPSSRCGRWSSTRRSRTGSGAAAGCTPGRARLRRRHRRAHQRRRRGAGRGAGARRPQGLRPPGHPAPQRAVRAARRRPALVRLVRLQRRQRARRQRLAALAFTNTLLAPMATLVVWMLLDSCAPAVPPPSAAPPASSSAWSPSPRPLASSARGRPRCSAPSRPSRATSPSCGASRTRLDDSLDVVAGARHGRHHRRAAHRRVRQRHGTGAAPTASCSATRAARHPGARRRRRIVYAALGRSSSSSCSAS